MNKWNEILDIATSIVRSYDTSVTLRQLFYRLVAAEVLPNTRSAYTMLSNRTAAARRRGEFPELMDRTRNIHEYRTFTSPEDAKEFIARIYRRDRTEGQEYSIYLGVEKEGIVEQLSSWFGTLGLTIISLKGYSSQSYVAQVTEHAEKSERPAILIYAGDFDPSGLDIDRDFQRRTNCFDTVLRVALNEKQITEYDLPPQMGKTKDSRAKAFIDKYGKLIQVELDALPPNDLKSLYQNAIFKYFDLSTWKQVIKLEEEEKQKLVV
jgi:hypothetical protein